jgi:hypothetical protein
MAASVMERDALVKKPAPPQTFSEKKVVLGIVQRPGGAGPVLEAR